MADGILGVSVWQALQSQSTNTNGTTQNKPVEEKKSKPVRFVAIGDTGSGQKEQIEVARQLEKRLDENPYSFKLMLGDNVYPDGNPNDFQGRYFGPYEALSKRGVQTFPVLGNHDVRKGNGPAHLAAYFPKQGDPENKEYFSRSGSQYTFTRGDVQFFALDTNGGIDQKEHDWLENELKMSKAKWKVAYAHHPIYSSGYHGSSSRLKKQLEPLLKQYGVDAYLAGHDHNGEYFKDDPQFGGVLHLISGGGGAPTRACRSTREKASENCFDKNHYLDITIDGDTLTYRFVDKDGVQIEEKTIRKVQPSRK